jgi:molybdopterin molybdotransferase
MTDTRPPLPNYDDALAKVLAFSPALGNEDVALPDALGRVLRESLLADRDQPAFHRSAMDGFALRSADFKAGATFLVTGVVAAGQAGWESFADQQGILRIATGAPLPSTFDVVIPIEKANVSKSGSNESVTFMTESVKPWQHIHKQATDAEKGQILIPAGTRIAPQHIGIAASAGATHIKVASRPRITLLTSGDEVRPYNTQTADLESQQIRNSNGPMLQALLQMLGTPIIEHIHTPDEPEQTLVSAREALAKSHIVITVGGVSVGQRDLLPWAWKQLGLGTVLHGVAIQPGKPVLVCSDAIDSKPNVNVSQPQTLSDKGTPPTKDDALPCKLAIGLPGNPVSVLATAHLFVWPVIRRMLMGAAHEAFDVLPWRNVPLADQVTPKPARELFRTATLNQAGEAELVQWHGSGDLAHTSTASGFVRLPKQSDPLPAGSLVPFLPSIGGGM